VRTHPPQKLKATLSAGQVRLAPTAATQRRSFLGRRAGKAFIADVLADDVIPLCAANAAQDKGSARQAINFLRKAAKLASENDEETVLEKHVRKAEDLIEKQRVEEGMSSLTTQGHLALAATTSLELAEKTPARTKDIYTVYKKLARRIESEVIAMRRMRDHLNDLDMQGILIKTVSNTGPRGGKYFKFELSVEAETATDILSDITRFQDIDLRL